MGVPTKHILEQGPVIAALGRTALSVLAQQLEGRKPTGPPPMPGQEFSRTVPPRSDALCKDLVRWAKGEPSAWRGVVPSYLFPQWAFPLLSRTLSGVDYPLGRALNAGCRMTVNRPLPAGEPLTVSAQLVSVDDDGRRAILGQRLVTSTPTAPQAMVCDFQVLVPLAAGKTRADKTKGDKSGAPRRDKERPRVPDHSRELARFKLGARAGLDFALLTGDFNPIHWIPAAARMSGFRNTILHGFGTFALTVEGLTRALFSGDTARLRVLDVRFTRPLVLPASVGLYVDDSGGVWVGDAPSGPAYMAGTFEAR